MGLVPGTSKCSSSTAMIQLILTPCTFPKENSIHTLKAFGLNFRVAVGHADSSKSLLPIQKHPVSQTPGTPACTRPSKSSFILLMYMECLPGSEHHTGQPGTQLNELDADTLTSEDTRSRVANLSFDAISTWEPVILCCEGLCYAL